MLMSISRPKLLAEWFWTDRWMGSSGFLLPMEARGVYREMLTQAWRRGARLPNDHEAIQRAIGATKAEWRRCWPKVERFWRVDGDSLVSDTQLEVYGEAEGVSQRASQRGLSGAQARHKQKSSGAQALPEDKPPSPSPNSYPECKEHTPTRAREFHPSAIEEDVATRAGRFIERYRDLYVKHRNGARYVSKPSLDFQEAVALVEVWDDERLEKIATVFLTTDHQFAENGSRTLAQFRSMASWCDGKLREAGL